MNIMYPLPELKIKTHQLEDLANIIETSGFNLVREDMLNNETSGNYSGSILSGTFSFTLNQVRWLMYEKNVNNYNYQTDNYKNACLRDVVFLSEKNDLIVKRNDTITQSNNAINVIRLNEFLKEYKSSNKLLMSKSEAEMGWESDAKLINAKYHPSVFTTGLFAFGGAFVAVCIYSVYAFSKDISDFSLEGYIVTGISSVVGGYLGYLLQKDSSNYNRKEAYRLITMMDNKTKENNYLLGQTALEYIDNTI